MSLEGKVAIITGGSRGIGKAIAHSFCQAGAHIMICSRSTDSVNQTADALVSQGYSALAIQADVSSRTDVETLVEKTLSEFGRIDILINNAGITRDTLLMRMKDEDWEAVIQTNLTGAAYCTREVIRPMIRQKKGCIINISSIVGIVGNAGQANYAAAKAGMVGLTKSVAKEVANRGIRVNAIAPGFITTDMTAEFSEENRQKILDLIPMRSFGSVEDVAEVSKFLASSSAQYITGQVIQVDGGMRM